MTSDAERRLLPRDVQTITRILFRNVFQNQFCMKVKSVVDDFICRAVTNLKLVWYFIDSQPQSADSLKFIFSRHCVWAP